MNCPICNKKLKRIIHGLVKEGFHDDNAYLAGCMVCIHETGKITEWHCDRCKANFGDSLTLYEIKDKAIPAVCRADFVAMEARRIVKEIEEWGDFTDEQMTLIKYIVFRGTPETKMKTMEN